MKSDFIQIFNMSEQRDVLAHKLQTHPDIAGLPVYGQALDKKTWLPAKEFSSAKVNQLLGQTIEASLPEAVREAIMHLSLGEPPQVVVLRGMPTGKPGHIQPEEGTPLCGLSMRGISALLGKQEGTWQDAHYFPKFNFDSYRNTGVQTMHSDYVTDDDDSDPYLEHKAITRQLYSMLHCTKADPLTPTYFIPYSLDRAKTLPRPGEDPYVIMEEGDVVIFNNLRVLHARGARLPSPDENNPVPEQERHVIALNPILPARELVKDIGMAAAR